MHALEPAPGVSGIEDLSTAGVLFRSLLSKSNEVCKQCSGIQQALCIALPACFSQRLCNSMHAVCVCI